MPTVVGALVLLAVAGGLLARDAVVVRDALLASEASLLDVRSSLGTADVDAASESLEEADRQLGIARSRSRTPLWNLVSSIPVVRNPVEVVRGVIDVATAATAVADVAVRDGGELMRTGLDVQVTSAQVDLAPLEEGRELVSSLPSEQLRGAYARLRATDPTWSPRMLAEARSDTLALAAETLDTIDRADALLSVLPAYLGADESRRYFLGVQTPSELRGTGGLIGFYAELAVDEGAFELGAVEVYEGLDGTDEDDAERIPTESISTLSGDVYAGVDAPDAFLRRYGHTAATGSFSNINVDPDLPTTARIALDLYELRTGEALDGMILLDPLGLQAILEATDASFDLPAELREGTDLPASLDASEFAEFITVGIYDDFGRGQRQQRHALLSELATSAFTQVFGGDWDGVAVGGAVAQVAGGRHLQVFSARDDEQASFEAVGAAGRFALDRAGDNLAVTVNNAVGGKQDVHLGHRFDVDVRLSGPRRGDEPDEAVARRTTRVRTELMNPLTPTSFDTYIVGNCLVDQSENQCFDGPAGHNRSWFSVWSPGTDRLRSARDDNGSIGLVAGTMHDRRVFDRYVETPPESSRWFELELEGPVAMTLDGTDLLYEFTWWRQAKAIPDVVDIRFTPPEGWEIVDAELVGGDSGVELMGEDRAVSAATLSFDANDAVLDGAVSRDATVQLRLGRA